WQICGSRSLTAASWAATSRSMSIRGTADRTTACTAFSGTLGSATSARRSIPWAAQQISTARQARTLPTTSRSLRTEVQPIDTWSSCLPEVGMVSTLAGWASTLFSLTSEAAVYCASMKPELVQAAGERRVEHSIHPPLADGRELGYGHGEHVGGERERLAVEVPGGHDLAVGHD